MGMIGSGFVFTVLVDVSLLIYSGKLLNIRLRVVRAQSCGLLQLVMLLFL
jgi:hypothetical protein